MLCCEPPVLIGTLLVFDSLDGLRLYIDIARLASHADVKLTVQATHLQTFHSPGQSLSNQTLSC